MATKVDTINIESNSTIYYKRGVEGLTGQYIDEAYGGRLTTFEFTPTYYLESFKNRYYNDEYMLGCCPIKQVKYNSQTYITTQDNPVVACGLICFGNVAYRELVFERPLLLNSAYSRDDPDGFCLVKRIYPAPGAVYADCIEYYDGVYTETTQQAFNNFINNKDMVFCINYRRFASRGEFDTVYKSILSPAQLSDIAEYADEDGCTGFAEELRKMEHGALYVPFYCSAWAKLRTFVNGVGGYGYIGDYKDVHEFAGTFYLSAPNSGNVYSGAGYLPFRSEDEYNAAVAATKNW